MRAEVIAMFFAAAASVANHGTADAATMTFTDLEPAPYSYFENGILAVGNGNLGMYAGSAIHFDDGGTSAPSTVTFTMGNPFNAISFDLFSVGFDTIEYRDDVTGESTYLTSYLNVLVQGIVRGNVAASLLFDMGPATNAWTTVTLGSQFKGLDSFTISVIGPPAPNDPNIYLSCPSATCSHFNIDNVVLAPVPLPASLPLGLFAIAALGSLKHRSARSRNL